MSDERRCLECDRLIYNPHAHDGLQCESWPEYVKGATIYTYRGCIVRKLSAAGGGQWHASKFGTVLGTFSTMVDAFEAVDRKVDG